MYLWKMYFTIKINESDYIIAQSIINIDGYYNKYIINEKRDVILI